MRQLTMTNSSRTFLFISAFFFSLILPFRSSASGINPNPGLPLSGDTIPFFPGGTYDSGIPTPENVLGFVIGAKPCRYEEMVNYISALDQTSPEVLLKEYGQTHEGRKLYYLIISSSENISQLAQTQEKIGHLADPRKLATDQEAQELMDKLPAVAWLAYGIHGDEFSGPDAALQLAYQLAAGTDTLTKKLKQNLIIIIDPLQNPDGRERILAQIQSFSGQVTGWDVQTLSQTGLWPWGRGNHYLFDLNRDWFALVHPESQGKIKAILEWNPQVVVDCHEMGPFDTYLFSPPREPFNPFWTSTIHKWWKKFASDQAKAFDKYGWSYYTREWNEEWFPGYGSSWSIYLGAVGILYEQAGVAGSQVKRPDRIVLTYRQTVHQQFLSSLANLTTAADNRQKLLQDYYQEKRKAVQSRPVTTYLFVPGENESRTEEFVSTMLKQNIEVKQAETEFTATDLTDIWQNRIPKKTFPKGTFLISSAQPLSHLVRVILEFDPRLPTGFLKEERKELEKRNDSKLYDINSWSVPLAFNLEAYRTNKLVTLPAKMLTEMGKPTGSVQNLEAGYGFLFAYGSQASAEVLARLLEQDYRVRVAQKTFTVEGKKFSPGTILLRKSENKSDLVTTLEKLARQYGLQTWGVNTALAEEGADLGGNEFNLLQLPKIGLLANSPINFTEFGAIWHLLDQKLGLRISTLDITRFSGTDLSLYNVLIFPSSWGGGEEYARELGKGGIAKLKAWVENGGTLIAIGSTAAYAADTSSGLSQVRLREQVLDSLQLYQEALARLEQAEEYKIDSLDLWGPGKTAKPTEKKEVKEKNRAKPDLKELKDADQRARLFMPRGVILRVDLDPENWLTYGSGDKVPVLVYTSNAFLAKEPVQTAGRFANSSQLRLGGLLWPEARERWARTAYLTRESKGKGQIILFAGSPNFRGYFAGSERLLINAFLLGPGLGADIPREW